MLDNILFIPFTHTNLISMLRLLKRGAKVKLSSQGARSPQPIKQKEPVHYEPISWLYALNQVMSFTFPAYNSTDDSLT
jgi:hypothetical protein